jgi:RNA 2',3'-cyclic 3'-phosphodiesterase
MRTFFCIPIPDRHCEELAQTAERLRVATHMRASWVPRQNYHITLRFLGDVDPALTVDLDHLCRAVCEGIDPFECILDRLGAFPTIERARVLWVGGEIPPSFRHLMQALSEGLTDLGFPRSKKESVVHATLARIKDRPDAALPGVIAQLNPIKPMRLAIDSIVLMESVLTAQGAVYTPLFTTELGTPQT